MESYTADVKASDGRLFTCRVKKARSEDSARDMVVQYVVAKFNVKWARVQSIKPL